MSVAVLERKVNTEEEDKLHNSQISEQYKKLIDPESTLLELLAKSAPVDYDAEFKAHKREHASIPVHTREPERTYRVENARADSELFRADSPINSKAKAIATEEEDNEDLRPTPTTIKYGTEAKALGKSKIETKEKKAAITGLTKRDKLIIAVACTVIIALFVLIIVNSAIISSLNNDISVLQNTLTQSEATYNNILAERNAYLDEGNLYQVVSNFATNNGMVLR